MGTIRQQIIDLLKARPLNLIEISQAIGIREKEVRTHLPHIAKSVAAKGGRLRVRPAACGACGFEFKDRVRLAPPGRCPRCRQERIEGPWYEVQCHGKSGGCPG